MQSFNNNLVILIFIFFNLDINFLVNIIIISTFLLINNNFLNKITYQLPLPHSPLPHTTTSHSLIQPFCKKEKHYTPAPLIPPINPKQSAHYKNTHYYINTYIKEIHIQMRKCLS